jgi:hypothetical protein
MHHQSAIFEGLNHTNDTPNAPHLAHPVEKGDPVSSPWNWQHLVGKLQ